MSRPRLPMPAYIMSQTHLSGHRVILGYETAAEAWAAHDWLSEPARILMGLRRDYVSCVERGQGRGFAAWVARQRAKNLLKLMGDKL